MDEQSMERYLIQLVEELVDMYGCTEKDAKRMIRKSGIIQVLKREPAFMDCIPPSSWAETIWARRNKKNGIADEAIP